MKFKRHLKISELIQKYEIETQEALAEKLREAGFNVTQATVSRDIKELRLVKVLSSTGKYKYAHSYSDRGSNDVSKFRNILQSTISSVDYAGNLVVVKCFEGMAQGAAFAIDAFGRSDMLGSIAGDDTVLVVMRSEDSSVAFVGEMSKLLKK